MEGDDLWIGSSNYGCNSYCISNYSFRAIHCQPLRATILIREVELEKEEKKVKQDRRHGCKGSFDLKVCLFFTVPSLPTSPS